jgi:hypothetical protein
MRTLNSGTRLDRQVRCVACATHMHPETVPWLQHEIGCEVRTAALGRFQERSSSRTGRLVAAAASSRA